MYIRIKRTNVRTDERTNEQKDWLFKVAPCGDFNGGLVTKYGYACVNSDLVVSKFYDRVNTNVRSLNVSLVNFIKTLQIISNSQKVL